jgi:hypothetical protein
MVIAEPLFSNLDFLFTAPPVPIFEAVLSVNRISTHFELQIMWSLTSAFTFLVYIFFAKHRLIFSPVQLPLVPHQCDVCGPQFAHCDELHEFCNRLRIDESMVLVFNLGISV